MFKFNIQRFSEKLPLEIIQTFVKFIDSLGMRQLDTAISVSSGNRFNSEAELINDFIIKVQNYNIISEEKAKKFLNQYCNINLDNSDTGSITGKDAGNKLVKSNEGIMKVIPVKKWKNPSDSKIFTITYLDKENTPSIDREVFYSSIRGLIVLWNGYEDESNSENDVNLKSKAHLIRGLNSSWIENALILIEESFGLTFTESADESVRGNTSTNKLWIHFINDGGESGSPCWIKSYFKDFEDLDSRTVYFNQSTKELHLYLNMFYLNEIDQTSPYGRIPTYSTNLNRLIAHELTHAVLSANIDYYYETPQYLSEGMAELVHGIDDMRKEAILSFLQNPPNELRQLYLTGKLAGSLIRNAFANQFYNVAGYILLRFFAEQSVEFIDDEDNEDIEQDEEIQKILKDSLNLIEDYPNSFLITVPTPLYGSYTDAVKGINALMIVQAGEYQIISQTENFVQIIVRDNTPSRIYQTVFSSNSRKDFGCFSQGNIGLEIVGQMIGWVLGSSGNINENSFDIVTPSNTGSLAGFLNPTLAGVTPIVHPNPHLIGYFGDYFNSYILNLATGSVVEFHLPEDLSDSMSANFEAQNVRGRSTPFQGYNDSGPRNISFSIELQADLCKEDMHVTISKLRALTYPVYTDGVVYPSAMIKLGDVINGHFIINSVGVSYDGGQAPERDHLYTKATVSIDAVEVTKAWSATEIEREGIQFQSGFLDTVFQGIESWLNNKVIGTIRDKLNI